MSEPERKQTKSAEPTHIPRSTKIVYIGVIATLAIFMGYVLMAGRCLLENGCL